MAGGTHEGWEPLVGRVWGKLPSERALPHAPGGLPGSQKDQRILEMKRGPSQCLGASGEVLWAEWPPLEIPMLKPSLQDLRMWLYLEMRS